METLLADLRYGARRLRARPGFTTAAVVTLALGIGANTAIYSVVDSLLLRPLPYNRPEALVQPMLATSSGFLRPDVGVEAFRTLREQTELFERVEAFDARSQVFGGGIEPEDLATAALSGGMMAMLGVAPLQGRMLVEADAQPGADAVAVISEALWRRHFGSRDDVLGASIQLDDRRYEIVGVMPGTFRFPYLNRQAWVPLVPAAATTDGRRARYETVARLREGVTLASAEQRLKALALPPGAGSGTAGFGLQPYMARRVNRPVERALYALFGAVVVVLLIASANVANLLFAQGAGREREIAVRASLGAARPRLIRQLLTETLLLALLGGAAGVLLAVWSVDVLRATAPRELTYFSSADIRLDVRSLAFALVVTAASAVAFGILPAVRSARTVVNDALRAGARTVSGTRRQRRLRSAFVVAQLALSVVLLVGAALLARTFVALTRIDPGFDTRGLVAASLSLPRWKYPGPEARARMVEAVVERLRGAPGVLGVALSDGVPPGGGGVSFGMTIEIQGRGVVLDDPDVLLPTTTVAADYFRVMRIAIRRGRGFLPDDAGSPASPLIINQTMARRLWADADPVGARIRLSARGRWYTVVGVADDVFQFDHSRPGAMLGAYLPLASSGAEPYVTFVVRTSGETRDGIAVLKEQIRAVDPGQPLHRLETIDGLYREFFAAPKFYATLMALFGAVGLLVAAVGLYGALAYMMTERTREFGIRLALGATPADILRLGLRHGAALALAGLALGSLASLLVRPAVQSMLVGVAPGDPAAHGVALALLASAALAASWLPGRRATRTDPMTALRQE